MRRVTRAGGVLAAVGLAAGLFLAGPGTASATAGCPAWDGTQPPVPGGQGVQQGLRSVAVAGPCDMWMVGSDFSSGDALIEHWTGGASWTAVPSPRPAEGARLSSVSAVSPADVWAVGVQNPVGRDGSGLALHWDGSAWTQATMPAGAAGLAAVAAVSARDVWAAGDTPDGGAFIARYDGTSWTPSLLPALTPAPGPGEQQDAEINALSAVSADDVWAAGVLVNGNSEVAPLMLHWDGTAWSQRQVPAGSYVLESVSASGPGDAWAVAYDTADFARSVILRWDGHSWTTVPAPSPGSDDNILGGVADISPASAVAVGWSDDGSAAPRPLVLRWDGHNWIQVPSAGPGISLFGVAAGPAGIWTAGELDSTASSRPAALVFGTVPQVAGDSQAAATDAMDSAGLNTRVTTVTTAGGGCGPATNGTIIGTSPAAGTFTAPPVTMTFCDFPPVVTVPSVVGLADNQAQGTLTNAGLTVGTITLSGNCSVDPGTVIRQNPAANTTASRGTAVNLVEATPPKPHGCAQ